MYGAINEIKYGGVKTIRVGPSQVLEEKGHSSAW